MKLYLPRNHKFCPLMVPTDSEPKANGRRYYRPYGEHLVLPNVEYCLHPDDMSEVKTALVFQTISGMIFARLPFSIDNEIGVVVLELPDRKIIVMGRSIETACYMDTAAIKG